MNPPAFLSDDQVEQLATLLDEHAVPAQGLNLEALDGFLSALAVGPGPVADATWQAAVWGEPPAGLPAPVKAQAELLLLGHWNGCRARVRHGDEVPEHLSPLLWLPESPMDEHPDSLDVGRDWALGFYRGVDLAQAQWDQWLEAEEWIDDIFGLLERLATGEVVGEDDASITPVSYRERLEITASLTAMLADLYQYGLEQQAPSQPVHVTPAPDRNGPCPCGSGKKYKKCCGAG